MEVILRSNDNLIQVVGLKEVSTGEYKSNASLTATLKTPSGTVVSGAESITLTYVLGSNGNYNGMLDDAVAATLTEGGKYFLEIDGTAGGIRYHAEVECRAQTRRI